MAKVYPVHDEKLGKFPYLESQIEAGKQSTDAMKKERDEAVKHRAAAYQAAENWEKLAKETCADVEKIVASRIAALRAPVADEGVQEAIEWEEGCIETTPFLPEYLAACQKYVHTFARALRAKTAALEEAEFRAELFGRMLTNPQSVYAKDIAWAEEKIAALEKK